MIGLGSDKKKVYDMSANIKLMGESLNFNETFMWLHKKRFQLSSACSRKILMRNVALEL